MKFMSKVALALGTLSLAACTAAPPPVGVSLRRAAIQQRAAVAQGYSEFLRGRYASLTNDPHQAAIFYANAAAADPNDTDLLERAVFTALISGDVPAAMTTAGDAKSRTLSQTSLPRMVLAVRALKDGKSRDAAELLTLESSSLFNDTIYRSLMAWAILKTDGPDAALALFGDTETGDALLDGLALSARGHIQLYARRNDDATETFQTMWDNGTRTARSAETLARLLAKQDRRDDAISILNVFSTRIGQNAAIEALHTELKAGRRITLNRPNITEGSALAIYTPAAALAAQTDTDLAGIYFALALELDPDLHIARTLWGNALDNADRRTDAIAVLATVPKSSVFYATSRGQMAWALRREQRNEEALATAREALAFAPDRNLKIQLGDLFRSLGEPAEAEAVFTQIINEDEATGHPTDWRLLYARGAAREQLDRWDEAEIDLVKANTLAPDQPALLNYLGYSWIDRGENTDEAFAMIQRAAELRPNAGFIIDSLGWAHFRRGAYDEAVKYLERAVELSPSEAVLNEHLGDAYWRVGRELEAGFQWKHALRLAPDNDEESDNVVLLKAKLETGLDGAAELVARNEPR